MYVRKTIAEQSLQGEAKAAINLTQNALKPGIYFVKLINENKQVLYVAKTIVQ